MGLYDEHRTEVSHSSDRAGLQAVQEKTTRVLMSSNRAPSSKAPWKCENRGAQGVCRPTYGLDSRIDAWIRSEVSAISPVVERLMRLIGGSHCIAGEGVELALREALCNAVVHGNRLDARKLVHVRCRCKVGEGISLTVSDQGQGFEAHAIPDPVTVENLEAEHGVGSS